MTTKRFNSKSHRKKARSSFLSEIKYSKFYKVCSCNCYHCPTRYKLDNGKFHTGKTVKLINEVHVIGGANDAVYWVRIGTEENKEEFTKLSHIGKYNLLKSKFK